MTEPEIFTQPSFYFTAGEESRGNHEEFHAMRSMLWDIALGVAANKKAILRVDTVPDEEGRRICALTRGGTPLTGDEAREIGAVIVTTWKSAHAVMYGSEPAPTAFDTIQSIEL